MHVIQTRNRDQLSNLYHLKNYQQYRESSFDGESLIFEGDVCSKILTGNELFYYPELAENIRALPEYPRLKRQYKIETDFNGLLDLENFDKQFYEYLWLFKTALLRPAALVEAYIKYYGNDRCLPIIEAIERKNNDETFLIINGLSWQIITTALSQFNAAEVIHLPSLLNLPNMISCIQLEEVLIGTPFIALRFAKNIFHTEEVHWYNLNDLKQVSETKIKRYKKIET